MQRQLTLVVLPAFVLSSAQSSNLLALLLPSPLVSRVPPFFRLSFAQRMVMPCYTVGE